MKRYVLRFRGTGPKPVADVARIRALSKLKVLDDMGGRMMLVEAGAEELTGLLRSMPDWVCAEEHMVPLPDPRQRVKSGQ